MEQGVTGAQVVEWVERNVTTPSCGRLTLTEEQKLLLERLYGDRPSAVARA